MFGTRFREGAKSLAEVAVLDSKALSAWLAGGRAAMLNRRPPTVGDKTMMDELEPAAIASNHHISALVEEALAAVTEAARTGMEATKDMIASVGRAKPLGARSLGHPDPGALSTYLILKSMWEYTAKA